jgi:hypothetical protein
MGWGAYFHPDKTIAETYSGLNSGNSKGAIKEVYLNIKNPIEFGGPGNPSAYDMKKEHGGSKGLTKWLVSQGYDGATNGFEWAVFDSSQIHIISTITEEGLKAFTDRLSEIKAGFDPKQERNPDGTWGGGTGTGKIPEYSKIDPKEVYDSHIDSYNSEDDSYGSTFHPITGKNLLGSPYFSVGLPTDMARTLEGADQLIASQIPEYLKKNADLLSTGDYALGTWYSKGEGGLYIDVVELVGSFDEAVALAAKNNQIGIYDLKNKKYIPTGGTGKKAKTNSATAEYSKFMRDIHKDKIAAKTQK